MVASVRLAMYNINEVSAYLQRFDPMAIYIICEGYDSPFSLSSYAPDN